MLAMLILTGFFGLAILGGIFVSANRKALDRSLRKKRTQRIKQRLEDNAVAS
jgi:hypothetical protein